jgi:uncharacterized C2H2 Zn-finger protein
MAHAFEHDKLVKSIARFLSGFGPEYGSMYYFEKSSRIRFKVYAFFASVRDRLYGLQCPFCGKRFRRRSSLVTHLIKIHYHDILSIAGVE